jgi:hypothetical protein
MPNRVLNVSLFRERSYDPEICKRQDECRRQYKCTAIKSVHIPIHLPNLETHNIIMVLVFKATAVVPEL